MAEFVEVMKQANRMCMTFNCHECPLLDCACGFAVNKASPQVHDEIERIVMDWAAEHPKPVYSSLEEAWKQLFPAGESTPCPRCYDKKYHTVRCLQVPSSCSECKSNPIPAEIAEKLGIRPKEVDE